MILFEMYSIYCSHENDKYLYQIVEQDITSLTDWFIANKLFLWTFQKQSLCHFIIIKNILNKKINQWMLSLNKKMLNTHTKKLIHYAHIYSHLSYCIPIWGGAISNQNFLKLSKLQNSCVRMINNSNKRAHMNPIYKSWNLLLINQILTVELQKFGYKLYHKNLPTPMIKGMDRIGGISSGLKTHRYGTWLKSLPNVLPHRSPRFNRSFLCKAIMSFTKLPSYIQNFKSEKLFIKKIRLNLLNS